MLWILAVVLVLLGVAGAVLPGLPGPVLVFAGILVAAWADDFARIGPWTLVLLGAMAAAAHLVDLAAAAAGVRFAGASGRAAVGAALGVLVGLVFGLPGVIAGPFIGAVLGELTARRDLRAAGRAGVAAWVGFVVGSVATLGIIAAMIAVALASFLFF